MSEGRHPPAGWYPDPTNAASLRWWDGEAWTDHTHGAAAYAPPEPAPEPVVPSFTPPAPSMGTPSIDTAGRPGPPPLAPFSPAGTGGAVSRGRPGRSGGLGTGVMIGLILGALVLAGGCTAGLVVLAGRTAESIDSSVGEPSVPAPAPAEDDSTGAGSGEGAGDGGDPAADAVSCQIVDGDTVLLELVNNSPEMASYFLTLGFYDAGGQRVGDDPAFVSYLRPGERMVEEYSVFGQEGAACDIIAVDRFVDESVVAGRDDVTSCDTATEADFVGQMTGTVSVDNSTDQTVDYVVTVTFVDSDRVRRGTGTAYIEAVRAGETAPGDIFSGVPFRPDLGCEVVAVIRDAS